MKKLLVLILSVVAACTAILSLTACDNGSNSGGTTVTDGDKSNDNSGGSQGGSGSETGGGSGETPEHAHIFNQKVAEAKYLATPASCTKKARYYYSCACGEKGTATFESGNTLPHTFDQEVAESKFLKSKATCEAKAVYYKSCTCGEKGTETFEYGELGDHPYFGDWSSDEEYHYHKASCSHDAVKDKAKHTYNDDGVCTVCRHRRPSEGLKYTYDPANDGYILSGIGSCADASIIVPSKYEGKAVVGIAENAFYGSGITGITIGDSVKSIGKRAFYNCGNLSVLTIGNGVKSIGESAFCNCGDLTYVHIGDGVTNIEKDAFSGCRSIRYSFEDSDNAYYLGNDANPYVILFEAISKSITSCRVNEGCKVIYGSAFEGCNSLNYNEYNNACYLGTWTNKYFALIKAKSNDITGCEINPDCKIVNNGVFNGCASLTSVTIPDGIISLGADMFSGCKKLTNVTLPNSVVVVGNRAFQNCTSLTSVTLSDNIDCISDNMFAGCTSLTSVTVPNKVSSIGFYAFDGCTSLTSVVIPNNVSSLGFYAFQKCASLTSVNIPDNLKNIGWYAFKGCSSLTSVVIPDGVESIGCSAFEDCSSLASVVIPNSVTTIGDRAFQNCTSLTSVKVSEKVHELDDYTFAGCSSLTSVTMGEAVNSIRYGVFRYCTKLTEIHYGGTKLRWETKVAKNDTWKDGVPVTCMIYCSDETFRI